MERRKKVTCLILSCFILLLNISTVKAEALPEVMNGSATIADCVMSYYAMAGAAVANSEWIQTLYDGLGSSFGTIYDFAENGLLTINNDGTWQATTALTDAIENSSAYTSLGLDEVFNISSAEAAAGGGVAAASGAATLSGAVGGVASAGVLPVLGGVTAAYWGGIAIGTLISHLTGLYGKNIAYEFPIINFNNVLNSIPDGSTIARGFRTFAGSRYDWIIIGGDASFKYPSKSGNTTYLNFGVVNITSTNTNYRVIQMQNGSIISDANNYTFGADGVASSSVNSNQQPYGSYANNNFQNVTAFNNEYQNWKNGTTTPNKKGTSNDLVGEDGNLQGEYVTGSGYTVPDMKPQIDPGVQSGVPLTLQDWLNFANSVSNNNSNTNPLPDNSALFDALIDRIVTPISNPNPDPDPDPDPDTYHPPVVTPVPDPDYDPVPDNPDQPDYESEKQKQTEPVPDEVPTGAPWTTDGLLEKFPFCIPKDMIDMVKQFSTGSRQAPYISWRFNPPGTPVDYTFNLDLSDFEDAATLIRMLELAAFVVGLAFATRYIIGAT